MSEGVSMGYDIEFITNVINGRLLGYVYDKHTRDIMTSDIMDVLDDIGLITLPMLEDGSHE